MYSYFCFYFFWSMLRRRIFYSNYFIVRCVVFHCETMKTYWLCYIDNIWWRLIWWFAMTYWMRMTLLFVIVIAVFAVVVTFFFLSFKFVIQLINCDSSRFIRDVWAFSALTDKVCCPQFSKNPKHSKFKHQLVHHPPSSIH